MNKNYFFIFAFILPLAVAAQSGKQRKADRLYENFAYTKAIEEYKELLAMNYKKNYNEQQLAESYYKLRDPYNAVEYYSKVVDEPNISPEIYYKYAQMLRGVRKYQQSREWLRKYQEEGKNPEQVEEFLGPEHIVEYPGLEKFLISPAAFNSKFSDFGTFSTPAATFFSSARGEADTRTKIYDWTGEPFLDIYRSNRGSQEIVPVEGEVNTVRHEGPLTISADGKTMYFTRNNYLNNRNGKKDEEGVNHLKIYKASFIDGAWDDVQELPFSSDVYSVGHPSLSKDGKTLYFVSEAPGGEGGSDIYKVRIKNNTYGDPVNLGPVVNTPGNEVFPFIAENGDFYFSSDGHKGFGLLDVFVVKKETPDQAFNLGEPVNSNLDDFGFSIAANQNLQAYISSNRPGGKGSDDIFEVKILPALMLKGQVTDSINGKPIPHATIRLMDQNNRQIAFLQTDAHGNYSVEVGRDQIYPLEAKHIEYDEKSLVLNTKNMDDQKEIVYDIELSPVRDVEYLAEINKIYFDFDKATIRPDAAKELDKLVNLMKNDYPELVIEIGSHTDSRGSIAYNRKLADRRAQATFDYLVANGIDAERILKYKGYGEKQLEVNCKKCNEDQHQLNRRSIFKVVKME